MEVNRANITALFKAYSAKFNEGFNAPESAGDPDMLRWQDIAMEMPSTTAATEHSWIGQLPAMKAWLAERSIQKLNLAGCTVSNRDFEATIGVPVNAIEDDNFGQFGKLAEAMGNNANAHWAALLEDMILANPEWADAKPFFASGRVFDLGSPATTTITNATTAPFSAAAFSAGLAAIRSWRLRENLSARVMARTLVVGPGMLEAAKLLVKGDIIGKDGVTVSNVLKGAVNVKYTPAFTGAHANKWFIAGDVASLKGAVVQIRKKAKFVAMDAETDEQVFMNKEIRYGCDSRGETFLALPFTFYMGGLDSVPSAA